MSQLDELNRAFNRAFRATNDLATCAARILQGEDRRLTIERIAESTSRLFDARKILLSLDPSLEYHYDASRPPTSFMKAIANLLAEADVFVQSGRTQEGVECLERALSLEPPPLEYEIISKRVQQLKTKP